MYKFYSRTLSCVCSVCIVLGFTTYPSCSRAECYEEGTFSVKPISINLSTMMDGYRKKNARIDGFPEDPYRGRYGRIFHRGRNMGVGYDLELGYFLFTNIELCSILSYISERGNNISSIQHGATTFAYRFRTRKDAGILLGGRYFWTIEKSKWLPFVSVMGGITSQGATKTKITNNGTGAILGVFKLQKRKTLGDVLLQAGADYRINECFALTFVAGAEYTNRDKQHQTPIPGFTPVFYKDNFNRWTFPIQISLRITF